MSTVEEGISLPMEQFFLTSGCVLSVGSEGKSPHNTNRKKKKMLLLNNF